ncbi:MucBP domain-containing protein, partial [Gracilibacillus alcaliphilus]|uniref:MucBP domain-containing protein n=1 Tax=Gracilibacillus alcaliphilus TaxID=1401441 RepID=UPI00195A05FC
GNLGETYKTEPKIITGYQLIETPENATGTFTEEAQTVTYVYALIVEEPTQGAPIEINYVDETGKAVAEPEKLTGNLGETYKTEPKIITGYQLIETPENATGTFTEEAQTVTYVYALIVEEPKESEVPETIEIILDGSPVEVYPGITVIVKDTQTTIQLPDDLPAGTLLQVLTTQLETQEGLTQAGEVYDFVFTYPKGEKDYTGEFILTMGVTETSDQTALYHYQKDSQKWERIGGTRENDVITATVTHFSIYGVLLEETVSPIPEEETPEPKEPSEQQPTESSKEKQTPKPKETEDSNPPEKDSKKEKSPALSPTTDTTAVTGAAEQTINLQENSDKTTTAGDLPHTATQQYNWLLAGIALLLLGGGSALWFRHKKD